MSSFARCMLLSCLALPALAAGPSRARDRNEWEIQRARMDDILSRARLLRPHRRDTPLREINISDEEIREIEVIAGRYGMNTMLNISPVIAGCPCEEGPLCTDQVYIVSTTPQGTHGLQLSRVRSAWVVGAVQRWWMRYEVLQTRYAAMDYRTWEKFESDRAQLLLEFPQCALKDDKNRSADIAQSRGATK